MAEMIKTLHVSWTLVSLFVLSACASIHNRQPQSEDLDPPRAILVNQAWDLYLEQIEKLPFTLDPQCQPRRFDPPDDVVPSKKIFLLHGFTACPQQFSEWAEQLAKKGVVVYTFLLPGHGFRGSPTLKEYHYLPEGDEGLAQLQSLEQTLASVAQGDSLPTHVGGLSVGGAVASNALLRFPKLFQRGIFFTPYFEPGSLMIRLARHTVSPVLSPLIGAKEVGWGAGCLEEVKKGRAGICTFRIRQLRTLNSYGSSIVRNTTEVQARVQFLGVDKDPAANSAATEKVASKMLDDHRQNVQLCLYREGVNHSLLSRYDSPHENKFWLNALLRDATEFVVKGQFVATTRDVATQDQKRCRNQ